jgi:flagellar basal-body rod protein FlgC
MNGLQNLFSGLRTSASGMAAERTRIDVIAKNLANAETTRMPDGSGPYRRQVVSFAPILERMRNGGAEGVGGVRVSAIGPDMVTPLELVHMPGHPDADENGMVTMPNVNATKEMADLITAVRAYEANMSAADSFQRMAERALRLAQP